MITREEFEFLVHHVMNAHIATAKGLSNIFKLGEISEEEFSELRMKARNIAAERVKNFAIKKWGENWLEELKQLKQILDYIET